MRRMMDITTKKEEEKKKKKRRKTKRKGNNLVSCVCQYQGKGAQEDFVVREEHGDIMAR
jgi:hypothetical protein